MRPRKSTVGEMPESIIAMPMPFAAGVVVPVPSPRAAARCRRSRHRAARSRLPSIASTGVSSEIDVTRGSSSSATSVSCETSATSALTPGSSPLQQSAEQRHQRADEARLTRRRRDDHARRRERAVARPDAQRRIELLLVQQAAGPEQRIENRIEQRIRAADPEAPGGC